MKVRKLLFIFVMVLCATYSFAGQICPDSLDFEVRKLGSSKRINLCNEYSGKVILVVNTASKCGFTPQFKGLEALYKAKKDQGLVILGFPTNDFGAQELSSDSKISDFCRINYGVTFPMFTKVKIKGANAHPFYKKLMDEAKSRPRWNFHKYLIGRDGRVIESFSSFVKPTSKTIRGAIDNIL